MMINRARVGVLTLLITLPVFPAGAATYYVSPNGGSGSGSISDPWSLDAANKQLLAGDIAILRGGLYKSSISPASSGNSDSSRITYEAYPGEQPIIDRGSNISGWERYSGTDNNNAVYRTAGSCEDMVYSNFEKVGRYVMLWNREKTSTRTVSTTTDPGSLEPGDYTHNGGYIYLRTGASDNPNGQNTICTGSGNGIDLVNDNFITVRGITIKYARRGVWFSGSSNNIIENNTIEYSAWRGVDLRDNSNHNIISSNIIKGAGSIQGHAGGGISLGYSYNLIEDNNISWTAHDGLISEGGTYNVVNNNTFTKVFGKMIEFSADYAIIENNTLYDGGRRKDIVRQHNIDHPMISVGGNQVIVRYNTLSDGGLGINLTPFKSDSNGIYVYNNTITRLNGDSHYSRTGSGVLFDWRPGDPLFDNLVIVNNLIFNNSGTSDRTGDHYDSQVGWNSEFNPQDHGLELISNQIYSENGDSQLINGGMTLAQFENSYSGAHDNLSSAPLVNSDLTLKSGSPSGIFLTNANGSGSGKVLAVDDARYFSDGNSVIPGDRIVVGSNLPVTITAIDYNSNNITISQSLNWKDNDNVTLEFSGLAPAIGSGSIVGVTNTTSSPATTVPPSPPTNLQIQVF